MTFRRALLALALSLALLVVGVAHTQMGLIADNDELWHLAAGRLIVETGHVPERDPFTFTAGDTRWVNTNWLAQVVLYELYRAGGIELDWLLGVAFTFGAVALVHRQARRRSRSSWAQLVPLGFTLRALWTGSSVRPQGWTFLLMALMVLLVERVRERPTALRGAAVALVLALAEQLHGGFVFVLAVPGLVLAGEGWDALRRIEGSDRRRALVLGGSIAGGLLGFAAHPHGLAALVYPLRYLDPRIQQIFPETAELSAPVLETAIGALTGSALALLLLAALVARAPWRTSDVLLVLAFGHLALGTERGLHYFSIAVGGPLAIAVEALGAALGRRARGPFAAFLEGVASFEPSAHAFNRLVPFILGAALALVTSADSPRLAPGEPGVVSGRRLLLHADTAAAARYIDAHPGAGRAWNEFALGGVLDWCFGPRGRVFMDGRGDLHGLAGTWPDYSRIFYVRSGWEAALAHRGCELVLIHRNKPLAVALRAHRWPVVYENASVLIFVKPGSRSEALLVSAAKRP